MKGFLPICVMIILGLSANSRAGYIIDGTLSDWGVTPFSNWVPSSSTADYIQMDDKPFPSDGLGFGEKWDFEAIYFDNDLDNLYFAIVTSCSWSEAFFDIESEKIGDLGIDLNGDLYLGPAKGEVSHLEWAILLVEGTGSVIKNPVWLDSSSHERQNSPYMVDQTSNPVPVGWAIVAHKEGIYPDLPYEPFPYADNEWDSQTTIIEGSIPRNVSSEFAALKPGDNVFLHITPFCGNDAINLMGYVDIPEPATILFVGLGMSLALLARRQKRDIN